MQLTPELTYQESSDLLGCATAVLSADGTYRYLLTRRRADGPAVMFVMLNPSTADAFASDPTLARCVGFARRWGYGGLILGNLYALRSTDPAALAVHPDPVGPENDRVIAENCKAPQLVIAAWGASFAHEDRPRDVLRIFALARRAVACLGVTQGGWPRHPLYVRGDTMSVPYLLEAAS